MSSGGGGKGEEGGEKEKNEGLGFCLGRDRKEGTSGDKLAGPSPGPECEIYLGMSRSGTLGESIKMYCPLAGRYYFCFVRGESRRARLAVPYRGEGPAPPAPRTLAISRAGGPPPSPAERGGAGRERKGAGAGAGRERGGEGRERRGEEEGGGRGPGVPRFPKTPGSGSSSALPEAYGVTP